jgi:hypothetical protein
MQRGWQTALESQSGSPLGQKVSVSINGKRLTSQYDSCIRFHVNGYHLKHSIQRRRGWDEASWNKVDFQHFSQHFRRLAPNKRVSHMKFVHDHQPLGTKRLLHAKIKDDSLALCPRCQTTVEDQPHLLHCPCNMGRIDGWKKCRQSVLQKDDPHPFWHCIVEGIEHWTKSQDPPTMDLTLYPPHLRMALTTAMASQTKIGWDNALRGFLSTDWMELASLDLESPTKYSESYGNARIRKALTCLYEYTQTTWENRNAAPHNKEANDLAVSIRSADALAIKHYHGKPHLLRFDDRHLCERPLSKLLSGSTSTQRR